MRERKSQYYVEEKKKQAIWEHYQDIKWAVSFAKKCVNSYITGLKEKNYQRFKRFMWVFDFLKHFLETFNDVPFETQVKLKDLLKIIEDNWEKNVSEIQIIETAANKELDEYSGENPPFGWKFSKKDGICFQEIHIKQWEEIEMKTGKVLNQIFGQVEAKSRGKDWHQILGVICDAYKKSMGPLLLSETDYFLKGKVCIICKQDTHRILFDCQTIYKFHN